MEPVASSQQFPRQRRPEPVLITEAEPSVAEQHAFRKKRYAITMGVRAVSIILAAAFYQVVWLMLIFVLLGTVLPWVAVLMANDRPPKKRLHVNTYDARSERVLESRPVRVIDG
jgi:Flp pilus assembly protein TadB